MPDIIKQGIDGVNRRFKDNGDGTFSEVVSASIGAVAAPTPSTITGTSTPTTLTTTTASGTVAAGARYIRFALSNPQNNSMFLNVDGTQITLSAAAPAYVKEAAAQTQYGAVAWSVVGTFGQTLTITREG